MSSNDDSTPPDLGRRVGGTVEYLMLQELRNVSKKLDRVGEVQAEQAVAIATLGSDLKSVAQRAEDKNEVLRSLQREVDVLRGSEWKRTGRESAITFLVGLLGGGGGAAIMSWMSG